MVDVRCRGQRAAVLFLAAGVVLRASAAGAAADASSKLVQELDSAADEDGATTLLAPYMDKLKDIRPEVVEKVVMRQWWTLARDLVAKSHTQSVDLSFAVRKAVRVLKEEADELLRTLNPKYGQAQQVSPAFQWAQNDTSIFLTIKYTVRWNAPGALEVTEPSVNMTGNMFNFSGFGKHSNNKYKYSLSLGMFDHINGELSTWSAASVGKLSVTLRKKWARKWPRFLANKKTKIGNMHVWSERQENLEHALSGMSTVSNSPVTCKANEKLYCLATDTCKKPDSCSQCPGKSIPQPEEHLCTGLPSEKASLNFRDTDMDENQIAGDVKITKARNDFDIDSYDIYWGKDDRSKLELLDGTSTKLASVAAMGADTEVRLPQNTQIPEGATHLLVFSKNSFGEYASPGGTIISDAVLPKGKPSSLQFEDEDGDKNEVSGTVTIGRADNPDRVEEYALCWGKSERKKISSGSHIRDVRKNGDRDPTHHISSNTKIPDGATHLLVYTKNSWGENPSPVSFKIVDNIRPCWKKDSPDCPQGVTVTPDSNPEANRAQATITVEAAQQEDGLSHYAVYWGRSSCADGGQFANGPKNGHIKDVPVGEALQFELDPARAEHVLPHKTNHVLVFAKSKYGESDTCVSAEFKDSASGGAEL